MRLETQRVVQIEEDITSEINIEKIKRAVGHGRVT